MREIIAKYNYCIKNRINRYFFSPSVFLLCVSHILLSHNMVTIRKASCDEAATYLCALMSAEDEEVQFNIDGGQFGRPVTVDGIHKKWAGWEKWVLENRRRETVQHEVLFGEIDGVPCGYMELNVCRSVGEDPVNDHCGTRLFGLIAYVIVQKDKRSQGIGSEMIRSAALRALDFGAELVVMNVHQDNVRAKALYHKIGFTDTPVHHSHHDVVEFVRKV